IKFQRVEIIERQQTQQSEPYYALVRREISAGKPPGDPQRNRRDENSEQIKGPVLPRHDSEPGTSEPGAERRMGRRTQADLMRPGEHFADVEMQILAALGDRAVERPRRPIASEKAEHRALAALGIDQRVE